MFRRILITLGYILVGFVIAGGTLILVAYGQGYTYDIAHHRFVHRGLILFGSVPTGAYITQDGVYTKHQTNRRDSYNPGSYLFKIDKPGYMAWSKTLVVHPGMVTDARYVILVPQKPVQTTVATVDASFATPATSTDHRHIAYSSPATATEGPAVWTQDLPGGKPIKRYSLAAATPTVPAETIIGLQWSGDDSHLLVITQTPAGRVYRVINADGTNPINLTDQYKLDFTGLQSLQFAPSDWHDLFWIGADGSLRRLDLNAQAVSDVLAAQTTQFSYAGDRLLYVNTTALGQSLMALQVHNPTQTAWLIPSLPKSSAYSIAYASYQGTDELVIIPSATHEATMYSGIFGSSPASTVVARNVDKASFTADGHLVALYSPTTLVTYDLELSTVTDIVNYRSPALGASLNSLGWFDNYHLIMNLGGKTVFSDFDGTNRVVLGSAADGSVPFASSDNRSVYTIQINGTTGQKLVNIGIR